MTITSPEQTGVEPGTSLDALALYAAQLGLDGNHLVTGLIAQVLVDTHHLHPAEAVRLAEDGFDDRVSVAHRRVDALIRRSVTL